MSALEASMAFQFRAVGLEPVREHRFHPTRRWRFDFCWPEKQLALELDGGIWSGGRHTRGAGFEKDCEKLAEAILLGWRVFRAAPCHVKSGEALRWVQEALQG